MSRQRTLLITGASSGIGYAVAQMMLNEGHTVIGVSRRSQQVFANENHYYGVKVDMAALKALPEQFKKITQQYSTIDGVVSCVGYGQFASIEEFSYEQIQQLIDLNVTSHLYLARAMVPFLKKHQSSDLLFIGSEAGLSGGRRGAVYCASKFALRGFAQALREESSKSGLRVSIVNPGMVKTEFFDKLHFRPGDEPENYIEAVDVAQAVSMVLNARTGTVFDEINLSPQKKVIRF